MANAAASEEAIAWSCWLLQRPKSSALHGNLVWEVGRGCKCLFLPAAPLLPPVSITCQNLGFGSRPAVTAAEFRGDGTKRKRLLPDLS